MSLHLSQFVHAKVNQSLSEIERLVWKQRPLLHGEV